MGDLCGHSDNGQQLWGAFDLTEPRSSARPRGARRATAATYDINVVGRLDGVTAPKQQRSEQSLQRVLAGLEALLQAKPFADIFIPEIAAKAGCSAATIYGRFKNKDSILAALHESLRERLLSRVDEELSLARWTGRKPEELASHYCSSTVGFYRRNRNLLAAVLLIHDREVYERAASMVQHIARSFAVAFRSTVPPEQHDGLESRVDLGVRAIFALLQQRLLFDPVRMSTTNDGSDAAFSADLARLLVVACRAS